MFTDLLDSEYFSEPESELNVPFVPTDDKLVDAMLELGNVQPDDLLYDLGCGDGRIVVAAAKERGATAVGIDMDPQRIDEAMEYAGWTGVDDMVQFIEDDLFCADFSEATVVMLYLLNSVNLSLRPRLLNELRPGTRIVSHAFDMGDWTPDAQISLGGANLYKWIVPAQAAGSWTWTTEDGRQFRVELHQEFQVISGSAWIDEQRAELKTAVLQGNRLDLVIRPHDGSRPDAFIMRFNDEQDLPTVRQHYKSPKLPVQKLESAKSA